MPSPQLTLLLQEIHPSSDAAGIVERLARVLATTLLDRGLWSGPVEVSTKGKSQGRRSLEGADAIAGEIAARAAAGAVATGPDDRSAQVEIYERDSGITIFCRLLVDGNPARDSLGELTRFGKELWEACHADASIGPGFSIRPLHIDYPRPLPPRNGYVWRPGDAAYFIDRRFHDKGDDGNPEEVALLAEADLPAGITRQDRDGLIVIACAGPAEEAAVLARQLGLLERWIGNVLSLPVAAGFTADGDRMVDVIEKEEAAPFTFYDPTTATAYRALAGNGDASLDKHELEDAAELAKTKALAEGQDVKRVVFIFPNRAAALRDRDALIERGAGTTVYIDEQGNLWEPAPPGDWLTDEGAAS